MKTLVLTLTLCTALSVPGFSQSMNRAQRQMDKYNFSRATELLLNASQKEKKKNAALPMLAECYRMQRDISNAKATYAKVVDLPEVKPESYYYYAQTLQATGDYSKAREMYSKFAEAAPADPRSKLFTAHCDSVLGPWSSLKPKFQVKGVDNINTAQSDFGPAIYQGDLIYASDYSSNPATGKEYGWTGRGFLDIKRSHPKSEGDFWGEMGQGSDFAGGINQEYHDGPASFTADGNTIFFTRSFYGKAKREGVFKTNLLKIYTAQKNDGNWSKPESFFLNSKDYSVGHPAISADGQTLYFVSDMPGGQGGTDIWMCKRQGSDWGQPVNLGPTINTAVNEMFPTIKGDNLYFSSEGHPGYGALDMFVTKLDKGSWMEPVNLQAPINSSYDDFAIAFASDDNSGFFSSNRPGGKGNDDIYAFKPVEVVKQPEPVELPAYISGLVKDKTTLEPLANAVVFVNDPSTGDVKILKTDANGMYKMMVKDPASFTVKAMMSGYLADCLPFDLDEVKQGVTKTAPRDLLLDKIELQKSIAINNIYYDFDKYDIREDAQVELDKLVQLMKENPITIELGSHTDCRGSDAYNDKLSQHRAEAAVAYIVSSGIDKSRLTAKGYGEHKLTNHCSDGVKCSAKEHQLNRRTEFTITNFGPKAGSGDQFDLDGYINGQTIKASALPADFFGKCK
jgi:outer membrane protein OmpA-like peptidoglycan-associated protein